MFGKVLLSKQWMEITKEEKQRKAHKDIDICFQTFVT